MSHPEPPESLPWTVANPYLLLLNETGSVATPEVDPPELTYPKHNAKLLIFIKPVPIVIAGILYELIHTVLI